MKCLVIPAMLFAGCTSAQDVPSTSSSGGESSVLENTNAPPPALPEQPPLATSATAVAGRYAGRTGNGTSIEDPISACGPGDSNSFVAGEFQCPEGGNPLGGDPMEGAHSRVGSAGGNSAGHIIDLYRIPCPSGPIEVYVDMYGCPEMQAFLDEEEAP